tara:strand:+ start:384 stop:671 length:288 start_codon:yes stop_codon:yes gene_type:complete
MDPLEVIGGAGTAGILAAGVYKMLTILEQQMRRRSGGNDNDQLRTLNENLEKLITVTEGFGSDLKDIKTLAYDIRGAQETNAAVALDRRLRAGGN